MTITIPARQTVTFVDPLTGCVVACFDVLRRTEIRTEGYRVEFQPCAPVTGAKHVAEPRCSDAGASVQRQGEHRPKLVS